MAAGNTYVEVGIREDLANTIDLVAPELTPIYSTLSKVSAKNTYFEWQLDTLAAASGTNAAVEGADITPSAGVQPSRVGNYTQLSTKSYQMSNTVEAVTKAGRKKEMTYQMLKGSKELRTDIETNITGNYASVAGNASTARKCGGIEAWLETNVMRGGSGADGGFGSGIVAAATDGTQRAFTETLLKGALALAAASGDGKINMISLGITNKQTMSGFAGIAVNRIDNAKAVKAVAIVGAADIYASDFGYHTISLNKFQRDRTALLLDTSAFSIAMLQPMQTKPLADTGLSQKELLWCEYTLKSDNEASSAAVADLTV